MALATTYCRAQVGMNAPLVTVETHLSNGLPAFHIVGLPEAAVKESKDRVRSALINSHFEFPARRITVNLAPAELPKQGGRYDLAIALGILAASGQIPKEALANVDLLGELSLSGALSPVHASLPCALQSKLQQRQLIVPKANAQQAGLSQHQQLFYAGHLLEVTAHLFKTQALPVPSVDIAEPCMYSNDFSQVVGQRIAKRALCIAAAGRHHLLMAGPPGSGKTLLASCVPSILPPMTLNESIETASIYSLSRHTQDDFFSKQYFFKRPFCNPHHSASAVALVGGGNPPQPGEISRAHNGVLFLDELPEFSRHTLESLREPLESGEITINRAVHKATFLSKFVLIATMNCCPCGYYLSARACRCTPDQIQRYQNKLSGPLLDRIDLTVFVKPVSLSNIQAQQKQQNISSEHMQQQVIRAHELQFKRQDKSNSQLSVDELEQFCQLGEADKKELIAIVERLNLSMRSYHKIIKVARTIADLNSSENITMPHIHEALSFRNDMSFNA